MAYPVTYPDNNIKDFFDRFQIDNNTNWAADFLDGQTNDYNNRRHPHARRPDEHFGDFQPVTLNYDPGVNPEIYRFLDNRFREDRSLPPLWMHLPENNTAFAYYQNTIVPLQRMHRQYFKVTDGNDVKHIYKRPTSGYEGVFSNNLQERASRYLGVYDEKLMGPEYDPNIYLGEPLGDRVIIGSQQIPRHTNNNIISRNLEARRPREEQPPQGGMKKRKPRLVKSNKTKANKSKAKKPKKRRKTRKK